MRAVISSAMNRFALIGASYKTAGVERLGQLALPKDQIAARLPSLAAEIGAQELAYIGTCNRVEFVLAGDEPLAVQACRDKLGKMLAAVPIPETETRRIFRAWTDEGAVEHLFLVAAGLDSAQAGEREIYAQVRSAWTTARAAGTCGPQLDYIFGEALRAAQDVHQLAAKPGNADSLANFAVKRALDHLDGRPGRIALVGVSPMTRHCARAFTEKKLPLTIVNRTLESAEEFAAEVKAEALALDAFKSNPVGFNVVITAVGGNELVLDHPTLKKMAAASHGHETLIIDLGVPPNVDPVAAEINGLRRVGMDEVIADAAEGRTAKLGELASARVVIDEHLERLRGEYAVREAAPLLQRLTVQYQQAAVESLRRLPRGKSGDDDAEALRLWAESFARRLAHVPMKGLRALAAEAGPAAVQAYLDGMQDALVGEGERGAVKNNAKEKRS
jgi:glutamyl-tRNA reductase